MIDAADVANPDNIESLLFSPQDMGPDEFFSINNIMPFGLLMQWVDDVEVRSWVYSEKDIPELKRTLTTEYIHAIKSELEYMEKLHSTSHQ